MVFRRDDVQAVGERKGVVADSAGLAGEAIPLAGRIVAVADAYDAMTSDRAYRRGLPTEVALAEIERGRGTQFDPDVAAAFLTWRAQRPGRGT